MCIRDRAAISHGSKLISVEFKFTNNGTEMTTCGIFGETGTCLLYTSRYHVISDEDEYIRYLIKNGMTHRELQELGFPLRKVQMIDVYKRQVE